MVTTKVGSSMSCYMNYVFSSVSHLRHYLLFGAHSRKEEHRPALLQLFTHNVPFLIVSLNLIDEDTENVQ